MLRPAQMVVFAAICASALAADLSTALKQIDDQRYPEAETTLKTLLRKEPQNGLYWFNFGSLRYRQKRYPEAVRAFERVIALNSPLKPGAETSLGICYKYIGMAAYDKGDYQRASEAFEKAERYRPDSETQFMKGLADLRLHKSGSARESFQSVLTQNSAGNLQNDARFFLNRIESRQGWSSLWAFLDTAIGYNSNVFLDGYSLTNVSQPMLQAFFGAGMDLFDRAPFSGRLNFFTYWEEIFLENDARFLTPALRPELIYQENSWRVRVVPGIQYQFYGTDPFQIRFSLGLQPQKHFGHYYAGTTFEIGKNTGQLAEYDYLTGGTYLVRLYGGYLKGRIDVNLGYQFSGENIGDVDDTSVTPNRTIPAANNSHGPSLTVTWNPDEDWELNGSLTYLFRHYKNAAQPGNVTRDDGQLNFGLRVSKDLSSEFALFLSLNATANRSTLDASSNIEDKNYSQLAVVSGVSWNILN